MLISITPAARRDLLEIWDVAADSTAAASRVSDDFSRVFSLIAENPRMGRTRDELKPGLRSFPVRPYVVFYSTHDDGIEVVRVLHRARDILDEFDELASYAAAPTSRV